MTDSKRDDILRKVRGLYAKAQSTEFEGERQVFMAKADQMMESYAIETWMLEAGKDEEQSRLVVRRDFNMSWWSELGDLPHDAKSQVWHLFSACVKHCRCYTNAAGIWNTGGCPVWGLEADLDFLNFLFTDLFVQLFAKVKPSYDPNKTMGHNVMIAKEAGMKYIDIALWLGKPEWRVSNGSGGYKTADGGKMLREYKAHLKSIGKTTQDVVAIHPHTWAYSYLSAFTATIRERFREMESTNAGERSGGAELVLRDIRQQAASAAYAEFPQFAKKDGLSHQGGGRRLSTAGYAAGGSAGKSASIANRSSRLGSRKSLGS